MLALFFLELIRFTSVLDVFLDSAQHSSSRYF